MTLALFALVVWLAIVVEATAGFGATVVTVTLASHLLPLPEVLAAFVPVNFVLSLYLVGRYRKEVDTGLLFRSFLPLMGVGMLAGTALFQLAEQAWLRTAFAVFVVTLSVVELLRARSPKHADAGPPPLPARVVALLGAVVGLLVALAGSGWMRAVLYGVAPSDPFTLAAATIAILTVCAMAVALPAWRAGRVDPTTELRGE